MYTGPMATPTHKSKSNESSRTISRGFRITYTQNALLDRESLVGKTSAIIRVLLSLYFNKKIPGVEGLISQEMKIAQQAELDRLERHRKRLKAVGEAKRNGTY